MASSDTEDDIIISSALLITSTLYQRRQVNVRKCKRNSWTCEWITAMVSISVFLLQNACERQERQDARHKAYADIRRCESDGVNSCMLGIDSAVCEWFLAQKAIQIKTVLTLGQKFKSF